LTSSFLDAELHTMLRLFQRWAKGDGRRGKGAAGAASTPRKKQRGRVADGEIAHQLTAPQRLALEYPGVPPAGLSYAIYDEMEKDSMIQTALTVKKLGVLAAPYKIVPAGDSPRERAKAEFVERAFGRMEGSPETILTGAMDAFAKGWSVQELVWTGDSRTWNGGCGALDAPAQHDLGLGKHIVTIGSPRFRDDHRPLGIFDIPNSTFEAPLFLHSVRPKDPALFGLEVDRFGRITGLRLQLPGEPAKELPRGKFVVFANRGSYLRPKGRSDLDAAHRHWQAKSQLLAAWKLHLERYASPTVLGRFQRGVTTDEQSAVLSALTELSQHTAIVFPDEIAISTLGGDKEASQGFLEAIEFHNREIARSILGQTLTTDEGKRVGSLAMGKVHLQVLLLQLEGIRRELADSVMTEQVIRPLVELNFGPGEVPRFEFQPTLVSVFARGDVS
jgi:hypothetical protein